MFEDFSQRALNKRRTEKFEIFLSEIIKRTEDLKDIAIL
jgi:hypothetical protein